MKRKQNKEEILGRISRELYINSRVPVSTLARTLGISHQTVSKYIRELEEKYMLKYTLDIDFSKLGFSEHRIIAIKLDMIPDKEKLIERIKSYPFVQNAYLGKGDFDVIIHTLAPQNKNYTGWEYTMRIELNRYKPKIESGTIDNFVEGFLPINKNMIKINDKLTKNEKIILSLLIENSRISLKELVKQSKLTQMKVIYNIQKLKNDGIIKNFTTIIQRPDKNFFLFFGVSIVPNEKHHDNFLKPFMSNIILEEDKSNITADYSVIAGSFGHFDSIFFTCFRNGDLMYRRGPQLISKLWKEEYPRVGICMLTDILIGDWPFNSNRYLNWSKVLQNKLNKIDITKKYKII